MTTEKISDRLYPEQIRRIQEIASEHDKKADVYEALVAAYDLIHLSEVKILKNMTEPVYKLLTELGKCYVDIAKQCESIIELERAKYNTTTKHLNTKLLELMDTDRTSQQVIKDKDKEILELRKEVRNKDKEIKRMKEEADLLNGLRKVFGNQINSKPEKSNKSAG